MTTLVPEAKSFSTNHDSIFEKDHMIRAANFSTRNVKEKHGDVQLHSFQHL